MSAHAAIRLIIVLQCYWLALGTEALLARHGTSTCLHLLHAGPVSQSIIMSDRTGAAHKQAS